MGSTMQIPLVYGTGRNRKTLDYTQYFPVNMVPVTREVKQANGYMRNWQGLGKVSDVAGLSRNVFYNTADAKVYRVFGDTMYAAGVAFATIKGSGRVSTAYSRTSVAAVENGVLTLHLMDGGTKTMTNWPASSANPTAYNWGAAQDVIRLRGRYVWSQADSDTFWISDIEDESHPDRVAAAYRAESMPDGILALRSWHDYVLAFGSATVEFFGLTGDSSQVYASQPAYMLSFGIAGQWAVCRYADTFAFLSGPASGIPTFFIMNPSGGSAQDIGNKQVKEILRKYTGGQLAAVVLESFNSPDGNYLVAHLPAETLVYDVGASQVLGLQAWSVLKTGVATDSEYRAIDFCNEGPQITCGDKLLPIMGVLLDSSSAQYGDDVEMILQTPMIDAALSIMTDLELDVSLGAEKAIKNIFVSASEDGLVYSPERMMRYDSARKYLGRAHLLKVGRIRSVVSFRFRLVGQAPAYLSKCRVFVS